MNYIPHLSSMSLCSVISGLLREERLLHGHGFLILLQPSIDNFRRVSPLPPAFPAVPLPCWRQGLCLFFAQLRSSFELSSQGTASGAALV